MSTHMIIARPDAADPTSYQGNYVHGDGEPACGGKYLFGHVMTHFGGDVDAALAYYLDEHPKGWSFLSEEFGKGNCYCCDLGEGKPAEPQFTTPRQQSGYDWTYILRPQGMEVHRFDKGIIATVPWDADLFIVIDWELMTKAAYAL